jgi:cutinase
MPPPLSLPAQENQYPADLNQGPGTNAGANDVAKRITSQLAVCPSAKFALVGYSQGARVVRIGATKLNKAALDRVVAAVVYGDAGDKPGARHAAKFPPEILAKLKDNCVKGDPVCRNQECSCEKLRDKKADGVADRIAMKAVVWPII